MALGIPPRLDHPLCPQDALEAGSPAGQEMITTLRAGICPHAKGQETSRTLPFPRPRLPSHFWPAWEADQRRPPFLMKAGGAPNRPPIHAVQARSLQCAHVAPSSGLPGTPTWEEREAAPLIQPGPQGTVPSSELGGLPPFCPQQNQVGRSLPRSTYCFSSPSPRKSQTPPWGRSRISTHGGQAAAAAQEEVPQRHPNHGEVRPRRRGSVRDPMSSSPRAPALASPVEGAWSPRANRGRPRWGGRGSRRVAGPGFPQDIPGFGFPGSLRTRWERGREGPGESPSSGAPGTTKATLERGRSQPASLGGEGGERDPHRCWEDTPGTPTVLTPPPPGIPAEPKASPTQVERPKEVPSQPSTPPPPKKKTKRKKKREGHSWGVGRRTAEAFQGKQFPSLSKENPTYMPSVPASHPSIHATMRPTTTILFHPAFHLPLSTRTP